MGEVYRARDTRLGRDVALKILPEEFARDVSRRQRFELEARAVAALNHPNIVAIYDVGEGYIVSELVDGESLRGAHSGPRKTIEIATQIAAGLAATHEAGIVHRDLKPDNILLTRDGRVKILDFGLAKISAPPKAEAPGETVTMRTEPGTVMGTVGYMSPEQVRGLVADHRSDIFSLGLILHELLTGKRAFSGETSVEIMTAILKQEPPDLPESVPAGLRQIVAHCLEKEPGDRFQSAKDLGFALANIGTKTGARPVLRGAPSRRGLLAAGSALIAAILALYALWLRPRAAPEWSGVMLGGPEVAFGPRLSPDGHLLAFIAFVGDSMQVGVMKLESGDYAILTHATDKGYLGSVAWSLDGARIYYDRWTDVPRGIYSVPVLGGTEQLLLEEAGMPEALSDGSLFVARYNDTREYQLFRFWPDTGRLESFPIRLDDDGYNTIRGFPDGQQGVALGVPLGPSQDTGRHIYTIDLKSGALHRLAPALKDDSFYTRLAVTRDGKFVLATLPLGNVLKVTAISRDGRTMNVLPLTLSGAANSLDCAADGSIFINQFDRPGEILRFSPSGGRSERIARMPAYEVPGGPYNHDELFAVLPDGRVVLSEAIGGHMRLLVIEAGKDPIRLVNTLEDTSAPVAAAGPGQVAFLIGPEPRRTIAVATVATGRILRRIPFDKGEITSLAASPDGKTLFCAAGYVIWSLPVSGGEPKRIRVGDHVAVDPSGQYLLVEVGGTAVIHLIRVPLHGGAEQEISLSGDLRPAYYLGPNAIGPDGRIVMPLGSSTWYWPAGLLDPAAGRFTRIAVDRITDFHSLGWTPDGQVMALGEEYKSKLWKFYPVGR